MTIITDLPILDTSQYTVNDQPIKKLLLSDRILCYNNGHNWVVVPLDLLLKFPLIYLKIYNGNNIFDATLVSCPYTLRSLIVNSKLKMVTYQDGNLILKKNDGTTFPIDFSEEEIDPEGEFDRRFQVDIKLLRNTLTEFIDVHYLHSNIDSKHVIDKMYLTNYIDYSGNQIEPLSFHPKTLVHIFRYKKSKTKTNTESPRENNTRTSIIVGKDANNINTTGYDPKKSGYNDYLGIFENKIIEKDTFIMPMFYYMAKKIYPNAKVIVL